MLRRLAICLAALLSIASANAQVMPAGFGAYKHVRWGADEGAPDGVQQIAQTPDGYLWLAGDALYRFDGATFERIDWPAGTSRKPASPSGLMVDRQGQLWVGLRGNGGLAVYRGGVLKAVPTPDPPFALVQLAQAPDGTIWAATAPFKNRLYRLRAGRWEKVDDALKLPPGAVMAMLVAPDGGVWVALTYENGRDGAIAYLAPDAASFRKMPFRLSGRPRIAFDSSGALWAADATGVRKLLDARGKAVAPAIQFPVIPGIRTASLAFDRSGGLWGTTSSVGIFHLQAAATAAPAARTRAYQFSAANGLTSDFTYAQFVDREGSVWIGSDNGIDQFRRAAATQELAIPTDPIPGLAIAGAKDGSVYIESRRTLFRVPPHGTPQAILTLGGDDLALCAGHGEGIWVVQPSRTLHIRGDRSEALPAYPGGTIPAACAEDGQGRLWASLFDGKLVWRDGKGWHAASGALAELRTSDMVTTPSGDLAFTSPGVVAILHGNRLTVTRLAPALAPAKRIARGMRDVLVSGSGGLVRVRDGRFARLDARRFPWVAMLRTLVQTPRGETWMVSRTAISRVATADLDRAFDDPRAPLERTVFDARDGLTSTMQHDGFTGVQAVTGGDGRIWFLNRQGAAFFDPATLERNSLAPPVAIRSFTSGGQTWRDPGPLDLKPGTHAIDINYAGLSLAMPQRVRFRYRLEGVDDGWVDAGARRLASYANLGPGRYRFHVIAANNDGVWNKDGASLQFEIRPTFMQSWPFKLLCALAVLLLVWFAYSMRVRAIANRIRLRMAARLEERERIARELHDTLLQAIQSLTLRFQLAVDDLPPKQVGRPSLIEAIDTADRVIAEGRDRVHDLRSRQDGDIEQILTDLIARQGLDACANVALTVVGTPYPMDSLALDEITRIAGEALFNIRRHAHAAQVTVEIRHAASFVLRIADDGVGIAPQYAAIGKQGHFGLSGMRERARKLHGGLVIRALPDRGTELVLTVPGRIAYKPGMRGLFARLWSS